MDRFYWNGREEKLSPSEHASYIEEMQEENKVDLVRTFIWSYMETEGTLPEVETVLTRFQDIHLDTDMIKYYLNEAEEIHE